MDSIVQEASSIAKAVEAAWEKAGKPQKFSIRVFEDAQKNFFGITIKPAKIAILFEKRDILKKALKQKDRQPSKKEAITIVKPEKRPLIQRIEKPAAKIEKQPVPSLQEQQTAQKTPRVFWTDEMVTIARNWMKVFLEKQGKQDISFTTEVKRYYLRFNFAKPVDQDQAKQKNLFRNVAYMIMQTVRNRMKKHFRYHKVVITCD